MVGSSMNVAKHSAEVFVGRRELRVEAHVMRAIAMIELIDHQGIQPRPNGAPARSGVTFEEPEEIICTIGSTVVLLGVTDEW